MKKFLLVVGLLSVSGAYSMEQKSFVLAQSQLSQVSQDVLNKKLLSAAARGDTPAVIDLLDRRADINCGDDTCDAFFICKGRTPLFLASHGGHLDTVMVLLEKKAKVNIADNDLNTPLIRAVLAPKNKMQIIGALIEHGADLDAKNNYGRTSLHFAAMIESIEIVKMLFLADLKKLKNENVEVIIKQLIEQADRRCKATTKHNATPYGCCCCDSVNGHELAQLLNPADLSGIRATFIREAIEKKLAQEKESVALLSSSSSSRKRKR